MNKPLTEFEIEFSSRRIEREKDLFSGIPERSRIFIKKLSDEYNIPEDLLYYNFLNVEHDLKECDLSHLSKNDYYDLVESQLLRYNKHKKIKRIYF